MTMLWKKFAAMLLRVSHSLLFDMQHDIVLKKLNFGLHPIPAPKVHPGGRTQAFS